jgi:hypothetical protein
MKMRFVFPIAARFVLLALPLGGISARAFAVPSTHVHASHTAVSVKSAGYVATRPVATGGYTRVAYRGGHVYRGGYGPRYWYGPRWWVAAPAIGVVVPFLPWGYSTIWWGGVPYYYYNNVYYLGDPDNGYRVVAPPPSARVEAPENPADRIFAYPLKGQSSTDATFDKIACEKAATDQTGYNPAQSPYDAARREAYRASVFSCLEARGYSAK